VALLLSVVSLLPPSRLIEVLLDTLSLSAPITPLTRELGGSSGGAKMQLVFIPKRGLTEKGIDSVPRSADPIQLSLSLSHLRSRRILADEATIVRKYDELMGAKEEREQKERRKKNRLRLL
jgi:hypothetical protein